MNREGNQGTPGDGGGNSPPGRAPFGTNPGSTQSPSEDRIRAQGTGLPDLPRCRGEWPELFGDPALQLAPSARFLGHPGLGSMLHPSEDPFHTELDSPGLRPQVELRWRSDALDGSSRHALAELGRGSLRELPSGRGAVLVDRTEFLGLSDDQDAPALGLLRSTLEATLAPLLNTPPGGIPMGIVNLTPDSFSDGGRFDGPGEGLRHALELEAQGAAILDLGGESTRPGSKSVGLEEERRRVLPTLESLVDRTRVPLSVDTTRGELAAQALALGARIINDTTAGRGRGELLWRVAEARGNVVLMHMRGEPRTMQAAPSYVDPVGEVLEFLRSRVAAALRAGLPLHRIWIDPGIGFGKTLEHNLAILRRLDELRSLGLPVLLGTSRKSFIDHLARAFGAGDASADAGDRIGGTVATVMQGALCGVAVHRVHDVRRCAEALRVARGILHGTAVDPRPPKP